MLKYKNSLTGKIMCIPDKNMHPILHGDHLLNIKVDKKALNYEMCIIFPTRSKVDTMKLERENWRGRVLESEE